MYKKFIDHGSSHLVVSSFAQIKCSEGGNCTAAFRVIDLPKAPQEIKLLQGTHFWHFTRSDQIRTKLTSGWAKVMKYM